ncbi:Leucine-rich repeat transmembrane neuronal protein 2, partial [Melipona quadrifasciata]
ALQQLTPLHMFNASYNSLDSLSEGLLASMRELQEIHLAYTGLRNLHKSILTQLDQLLVLNLVGNRLNSDDETTFLGLIRLIALDLSYNALTRVRSGTCSFCRSSTSNNTINQIESNAFLPLYNFHTLELSGNAIASVDPLTFRDCSNLKELDLSGNELTTMPDAPRDLALLKTLDHGENRSNLYNGSFLNFDQLTGSRFRMTYRKTSMW